MSYFKKKLDGVFEIQMPEPDLDDLCDEMSLSSEDKTLASKFMPHIKNMISKIDEEELNVSTNSN